MWVNYNGNSMGVFYLCICVQNINYNFYMYYYKTLI